jgi:hypothetical protein
MATDDNLGMEELTVEHLSHSLVMEIKLGYGALVMPSEIAKGPGDSMSVFILDYETLTGKAQLMFDDGQASKLLEGLMRHMHNRMHASRDDQK